MDKRILILFITFLWASFSSQAQPRHNSEWEKLGTRTVNYRLDRDVIHVGARKGGFTKLKVLVRGGAINMHKMIIEYRNGSKETITLKHTFTKRSASRLIDIKGHKRIIKDITFVYDTKNLSRGKASVHVFGRH